MLDGPRYVSGLQDIKESNCYKDFFEGENEKEAIEKAQEEADKVKRKAIVYDRKEMKIIHRLVPKDFKLAEEEATASAPTGGLKKKQGIKRK